jgi:RNA polymerase sigma factor (sigma-70 family)
MNTSHDDSAPLRCEDLLKRLRAGDAEARNELITYCYPKVQRLVEARMGRKLRLTTDPLDIVHETMLAACEKLDGLELEECGQLIHWLGKVATYRIIGAARVDDRLPPVFSSLAASTAGSSTNFQVKDRTNNLSPSARVVRNEDEERLYRAMETLSERHREVIYLVDFAQASWAFVAKEMGFKDTPGAHMLYSRAAAKLASELGNES